MRSRPLIAACLLDVFAPDDAGRNIPQQLVGLYWTDYPVSNLETPRERTAGIELVPVGELSSPCHTGPLPSSRLFDIVQLGIHSPWSRHTFDFIPLLEKVTVRLG